VKVAWDARVIFAPQLRGMGSYAVNLLRAMGRARPELEPMLLIDESTPHVDRVNGLRPRVVGPSRGYRWQLWEQVGLPWHTTRLRADLLHSPANTAPRLRLVPQVVTVHDVIPYLPEIADRALEGRYWRHTVPQAIRNADAVITDSESSRQDLIRVLGLRQERITVVPLAVGADVERPADETIRSVLAVNGVQEPYVLSLAAPAPRKNTAGVLRVFARLLQTAPELQLVLTGVRSPFQEHVVELADALRIPAARLRLLDYVDAATRNALYAGAAVFLFLSLYEGFGLPILEAMRCGAPVLCSNRSSCPEVAGSAAVMVNPADEDEVIDALLGMLRAPAGDRACWQSLGAAREREFTWTRAAELTLKVYDAVAN
jgi:glycosyltransferase involved in cell wall biosynthesis